VQSGDLSENSIEPEVPRGLSALTAPQEAMVEFLRVDGDLISAAAEGSDQTSDDRTALLAWARALAPRPKVVALGRTEFEQLARSAAERGGSPFPRNPSGAFQ
jgi:hypothetical protein